MVDYVIIGFCALVLWFGGLYAGMYWFCDEKVITEAQRAQARKAAISFAVWPIVLLLAMLVTRSIEAHYGIK
jgi:hypothetical protein